VGRVSRTVAAVLALGALAIAGCAVPADPEGTLERVRGGTMLVGVTENAPWVRLVRAQPTGIEPALVRQFARSLGAQVEWVRGSESELMAALHEHEIDLVVGGLTRQDSPWEKQAAITRPYVLTRLVVGVPPGVIAPTDLEGVEVVVEDATEAAALVERKTDASVERVPSLRARRGRAAVVGEWQLGHLGLETSDVILSQDEHVMAVSPGENAWQAELERFLLARPAEIQSVLDREGRP
jgi:polar amino acid transport system substrate-binding protein